MRWVATKVGEWEDVKAVLMVGNLDAVKVVVWEDW